MTKSLHDPFSNLVVVVYLSLSYNVQRQDHFILRYIHTIMERKFYVLVIKPVSRSMKCFMLPLLKYQFILDEAFEYDLSLHKLNVFLLVESQQFVHAHLLFSLFYYYYFQYLIPQFYLLDFQLGLQMC